MAKGESSTLCLLSCLVTGECNATSYDCCCSLPHIVFVHIFTIVHFPSHRHPRPLFTYGYAASLRPGRDPGILCRVIFSLIAPNWYALLAPGRHISFVLETISWLGFFLLPVSKQGPDPFATRCTWFRDLPRNKLLALSGLCPTNWWSTFNTGLGNLASTFLFLQSHP